MLKNLLPKDWQLKLETVLYDKSFSILENRYKELSNTSVVYPPREDIFKIFEKCPLEKTKVLILGQDPYHQKGQAHGLSFSVPSGIKITPSLQNIFKELKANTGIEKKSGDLTDWAAQGVLLLNTVMTVTDSKPNSHKNIGWEIFTDEVIRVVSQSINPVVFVLWGKYAQEKKSIISQSKKHLILESSHPSPFSAYRGFLGSQPFSKINDFLNKNKLSPINWAK